MTHDTPDRTAKREKPAQRAHYSLCQYTSGKAKASGEGKSVMR